MGGFIFQWTDGWWKHKQEENLDVHDTTASWPNDAYPHDHVPGKNNMNEEWFGIAAIEDQDADGFYQVQPRVAYYVLRDAFRLDPYAETTTTEQIRTHFSALEADDFAARALMPSYCAAKSCACRPVKCALISSGVVVSAYGSSWNAFLSR